MAIASRKGALYAACLLGAMCVYFVWVGVNEPAWFRAPAWGGYIAAFFCFLFAVKAARIARHPESHDPERPSWGYRLNMVLEGGAYLLAALFGLDWLLKRAFGRAEPPDEGQRIGLWVLGALALLLVAFVVKTIRRRRQTADPPTAA